MFKQLFQSARKTNFAATVALKESRLPEIDNSLFLLSSPGDVISC